jgi:hypothetical protein
MTQNRYYSSPALSTTLASAITTTTTTSVTLSATPASLGWPGTFPYTMLVDWGTTNAEAMLVTANPSGATLTVERGFDGTIAVTHSITSYNNVFHGVTGDDLGEPQTHMYAMGSTTYPNTANGASSPTTVPVHGVTNTPSTSGYVVTSDSATAASWKTGVYQAAGTYVTSVTGTSPVASSGGTTPALSIQASSTSQAGSMSAAQATTLAGPSGSGLVTGSNGWYDVTQYGLVANATGSASANVTAINTLLSTTATAGSTIWFPPGVYYFNAAWNSGSALSKAFSFQGVYGQSSIAMTAAISSTAWIVACTTTNDPTSFINLCFFSSGVNQTTGATVEFGTSTQPLVANCQWNGGGGTNHLWNCLSYNGGTASPGGANGGIIDNCNFGAFAGTAITVTSCIGSHAITNCLITGGYTGGTAAAGITETNSTTMITGGSAQINNCDIIGCVNNVLITAVTATSSTVASVFMTQCFLDQATGSGLLITGGGTVARCHFESCWFTVAASSSSDSAIQITTTGSSIHTGIVFDDCWILNTPAGGGTPNGIVATAVSDIQISNCRIAGWTGSGISLTPAASNSLSPKIMGNTIGPSGGVGGNGTGITLAANGADTYGAVLISDNLMIGNTTAYTQGAWSLATTGTMTFINNQGVCTPAYLSSAFTVAATATGTAVTGITTYLPIGTYIISGTFIGLSTSATANVHDFAWVASGGLAGTGTTTLRTYFGVTTAGLAAVPTLSFNADATWTATMATTALTASEYSFMDFYLFLVVSTAGTITLDAWGATASTLTLEIGSFITFNKVA